MEEQQEIWKPIIIEKNGVIYDYTGLYEVSNMGRVRSLDMVDARGQKRNGRILKLQLDTNGYLQVGLHKNREKKNFSVHRLVATMFIPNPDNLPFVNHLDENKTNAVWTNLEWCTHEYNTRYSSYKKKGQKRTDETKQKISESKIGDKNPWYGVHRNGEDAPNTKKVICLDTQQIFSCIKDAEAWCGKKGVGDCCKGKQKTAGRHPETGERLHWSYYEDWLKLQKDDKI